MSVRSTALPLPAQGRGLALAGFFMRAMSFLCCAGIAAQGWIDARLFD